MLNIDNAKIFAFVTNMLEEYRKNINKCSGKTDYLTLVVSILMFAKLMKAHFKEDFERMNEDFSSEEVFVLLDEKANYLTEEFLKQHANRTLN